MKTTKLRTTLLMIVLALTLFGLIWALVERNRAVGWMRTMQQTLDGTIR